VGTRPSTSTRPPLRRSARSKPQPCPSRRSCRPGFRDLRPPPPAELRRRGVAPLDAGGVSSVGFAAEPCQGFEVSSVAWFLQTALALLAFGSRPESTPERLHRRAMHCLEVLEREACAVENFEQLLDERDAPRELVGDALQRLLRIYARRGDDAQVRVLLRRYWDVGMKRRSLVHVPYSVRYFPAEIDVLMSAHLDPLTQAPVWNGI